MKVTQEWLDYQEAKKNRYKAERTDVITNGFTDKEFNQSMKMVQRQGKKGKVLKHTNNKYWRYNSNGIKLNK